MAILMAERPYEVIEVEGGVPIYAWVKGVPFEEAARTQVENVARLTCVHPHVAVMPDVHAGKGSTVGCVIPTMGAVIPAAVGVDIGCGMLAARTSLTLSDLGAHRNEGAYRERLKRIRSEIEARVPHGRTDNGGYEDVGAWKKIPEYVDQEWHVWLAEGYEKLCLKVEGLRHRRALGQLGTLGTGNHFIEICVDADERVWIMLHSGSRGPGNKIGVYYTKLAQSLMQGIALPDRDLAFLVDPQPEFFDYLEAVDWAQGYAEVNRNLMFRAVKAALKNVLEMSVEVDRIVNCHHNYIADREGRRARHFVEIRSAPARHLADHQGRDRDNL